MAHIRHVDRPVSGPEGELSPADAVRNFVFMANLAAQEISGDPASSVSTERVLHRLRGSTESDSVLLALVDAPAPVSPDAEPLSGLGYPRLPATETSGDEGIPVEMPGFAHLSLPLLEERHIVEFECVLDVGLLPVPGEELSLAGRVVYRRLLAEVEALAARLGRTTLQLWLVHPAGEEPGTGAFARALASHGFEMGLTEIQGVIDLDRLDMRETVVPANTRLTVIEGYDVPADLQEGVLDLMTAASTDIPHGMMDTEAAVWTPGRLRSAAVRLRDRGAVNLMVALHDGDGVLAISEFSRHAGSDPTVAEQGVTIVSPHARGRGLGRAIKLIGLARVREFLPQVTRVYTSNAVTNTGMRAINDALGMETISRSSAWQKNLGGG